MTKPDRCMLCDRSQNEVLCQFPELTWLRCECGLIYRDHASAQSVEFEEEYFTAHEDVRRPYDSRTRRRVQKSRTQILDVLNHVKPGPLLDIGCSLGYTLQAAEQLGLEATGVDVSEHAVRVCSEMGYTAQRASMDDLPFADEAFQVIVMKHVLEHTPDPRSALEEVRRVLRPGGGLFIAVPHAGYNRAVRNPSGSRFYQPKHHGLDHFFYYVPETLARLLEEQALPVARVHPHLVHRRASGWRRTLELLGLPLTALIEWLRTTFAVRKEFWVVSMKTRPESAETR